MADDEQVDQVRREVARLGVQVRELRLVVLRAPALLAILLIVVGSVLPAWHDNVEGEEQTLRIISLGFVALADPSQDGYVVAAIGFLGLLLALVLLCWLLASSVVAGQGTSQRQWFRTLIGTLAAIGSVVASLLSLFAYASDESDVSGGLGSFVVLAGVVVAVLVLRYRPWQELWVDQSPRHTMRAPLA